MRSVKYTQIRLPEKYGDLAPVFSDLFTQVFNKFDIRDDGSVYANSLYFDDDDTLQMANAEIGDGTTINDGAKVTTQRVLPTINFANVGSVQSAIPITAFADASIATVSIAAHDVIYGGETVSYSAGEVIGVPVSTDVYIYADDADLDGGAVTYEFTTDFTVLAESKERYRVGAIRTPVSSISAAVSAATNANPCAVTTGANHNFTTGDVVDFSSVGGMTELNTGTFTITVTSPTNFTLNGTNSTAYGVYTSGGTVTRVSTPADGIGGAGADGSVYDIGFYY
jgi:hypothetical protein